MAGQFIPPNGFAGFAQQTPAVQSAFLRRGRAGAGRKRRRSAARKATGAVKRKVRAAARGKAKRFVKGSAAAKRHMAKLRRMRKR